MASDRNRKALEDMTEEQRAAVERIRARHRTPEYRAEERRVRELVREEFPPATPDEDLGGLLAALKAERERLNVSLTEMHERTGIDRATISKVENGHVANPTWATLRTYARALGVKIVGTLAPVSASRSGDVELCRDGPGGPCLMLPAQDAESLLSYLRARGIVCRDPVEDPIAAADGAACHRASIALDPDTDLARVRALVHRWKMWARERGGASCNA